VMLLEMWSYNSKYTETTSQLCLLKLLPALLRIQQIQSDRDVITQFSNELPDAPFLVGKSVVCVIHVWS